MVSGRMKVTTTTAPSAVLDSPRSETAEYESPLYESPPLEWRAPEDESAPVELEARLPGRLELRLPPEVG